MCEVSDKLQLCTCAKIDFNNTKHYWILHRVVKGQDVRAMGNYKYVKGKWEEEEYNVFGWMPVI